MLLANAYIIIKVKHITIAYNAQTKVLNNRICYTGYIIEFNYYLNSLNK